MSTSWLIAWGVSCLTTHSKCSAKATRPRRSCLKPWLRALVEVMFENMWKMYGGFLKWWYPTTGFPTKNWPFWGVLGVTTILGTLHTEFSNSPVIFFGLNFVSFLLKCFLFLAILFRDNASSHWKESGSDSAQLVRTINWKFNRHHYSLPKKRTSCSFHFSNSTPRFHNKWPTKIQVSKCFNKASSASSLQVSLSSFFAARWINTSAFRRKAVGWDLFRRVHRRKRRRRSWVGGRKL